MGRWTQKEIAAELGVTPKTIRNWRKDPLFRMFEKSLEKGRDGLRERILSDFAMRTAVALSTHTDTVWRVVGRALERDDEKVAMAVLRLGKDQAHGA